MRHSRNSALLRADCAAQLIEAWEPQRALVYCDESKEEADALQLPCAA